MKVITESEMNFGKFDEADVFHIEDSQIYKNLGSGIKTVEFILKYDENSIVFLEAKKSCPNAANRHESEEKEQKHREFSSCYTSKFVIEKERMYVENANRAANGGFITVDNLEPNPKNPIIAAFFRNIGYADQLGSGVRNLFKYSKYYSGQEPQFIEGDVFRIIVPLDDHNYDFVMNCVAENYIDNSPTANTFRIDC